MVDHGCDRFVTGFDAVEMDFLALAVLIKALEDVGRFAFCIDTHQDSLLLINASETVLCVFDTDE
jgi:hypothetical protein